MSSADVQRLLVSVARAKGFFSDPGHILRRNANPCGIRSGRDARGRVYPVYGGYVDFVEWASQRYPGASYEQISDLALREGWAAAFRIVQSIKNCDKGGVFVIFEVPPGVIPGGSEINQQGETSVNGNHHCTERSQSGNSA